MRTRLCLRVPGTNQRMDGQPDDHGSDLRIAAACGCDGWLERRLVHCDQRRSGTAGGNRGSASTASRPGMRLRQRLCVYLSTGRTVEPNYAGYGNSAESVQLERSVWVVCVDRVEQLSRGGSAVGELPGSQGTGEWQEPVMLSRRNQESASEADWLGVPVYSAGRRLGDMGSDYAAERNHVSLRRSDGRELRRLGEYKLESV